MELKQYQQQVLQDLKEYLAYLNQYHNYVKAYQLLWERKGVTVGGKGKMRPYKNVLPGVPHICFKVPTGGGKTLLACASIKPVFDALTLTATRAVVWLVPSDAILNQTIKNLKDSAHPYRQRLNRDFNGKVAVYTKEEALFGQGLNPSSVRDQLTVFVLSYDSFRTSHREGRRAFRQNSQLAAFTNDSVYPGYRIEYSQDEEWPTLAAVVRSLYPVVIVDESHHAQSDLSIDMLRGFNPVFTLDLTATPRANSNIISVVEAYKLKMEHMVKLPVIVSNQRNQASTIDAAIQMQKLLERKAKEEEKTSGRYIRPIVLLQAESRDHEESTTYEKLKQKLIAGGIPAEQIAVKTAERNDLRVRGKDIDLMSRKCAVRYIITVNALKEGWDCPFAYVLATIANRSSVVDVEQIVGRILRLPQARESQCPWLNMSYVFTNSNDFQRTLDEVVKGLNNAGFSQKDYRLAGNEEVMSGSVGTNRMEDLFGEAEGMSRPANDTQDLAAGPEASEPTDREQEFSEFLNLDTAHTPFAGIESKYDEQSEDFAKLFAQAAEQQEDYTRQAAAAQQQNLEVPAEYVDDKDIVCVQEAYKTQLQEVKLPKFFYKMTDSLFARGEKREVSKEYLAKDFRLGAQNIEIDFTRLDAEIYKLDIESGEDGTPKRCRMSAAAAAQFKEALELIPPESRKNQLKEKVCAELNREYNTISQREIKLFVSRIMDALNADQLADMGDNFLSYYEKIDKKVKVLLDSYYEEHFNMLLNRQEIFVEFTFSYQPRAIVRNNRPDWLKMLYTGEGPMNAFEQSIAEEISGLENVLWWHRNSDNPSDTNAYGIRGFVNHYPDFVVMTKKGHIVAVETKGEHLSNEDQFTKARLGYLLDMHDNNSQFSYFMVFEKEKPERPGCISRQEFITILSGW